MSSSTHGSRPLDPARRGGCGSRAGGREIHLRGLQSLALHLANSMFLGDYLTNEGQPGADDRALIADAGFVVEGLDERTLPAARHDLVAIRRRGAGTDLPPST